jgi:hypothetical protein
VGEVGILPLLAKDLSWVVTLLAADSHGVRGIVVGDVGFQFCNCELSGQRPSESLSRTETGGHVYRGSAGEDRQRAWEESFQSDPVIQQ